MTDNQRTVERMAVARKGKGPTPPSDPVDVAQMIVDSQDGKIATNLGKYKPEPAPPPTPKPVGKIADIGMSIAKSNAEATSGAAAFKQRASEAAEEHVYGEVDAYPEPKRSSFYEGNDGRTRQINGSKDIAETSGIGKLYEREQTDSDERRAAYMSQAHNYAAEGRKRTMPNITPKRGRA